jgi:hypothetical protein
LTWKQLIVALVVIVVAVAIVVGVLSSCGGDQSPKHRGATLANGKIEDGRGLGKAGPSTAN